MINSPINLSQTATQTPLLDTVQQPQPAAILSLPAHLEQLLVQSLQQFSPTPIQLDPNQLAYRWQSGTGVNGGKGQLVPLKVDLRLSLDDLLGIDTQKAKLLQNTRQYLAGLPANHVLMTGTRGAGKSSLIRALLNECKDEGLRIIEVARDDLVMLDPIRQAIVELNQRVPDHGCHYVVYCDDLAFNGQDENYRTLKSVLDGALDSEQDKLLVYATSNRRHLLPQMMKDNVNIYNGQTDEVNPYEVIDETVSLSDRFGVWLSFYPMPQPIYLQIVAHYLQKAEIAYDEISQAEALKWASQRGGRSGRVAYQFSRHWIGAKMLEKI